MNLTYNVSDRPSFGKVLVFALQQILAILAATIAVPSIVGNGMSQSAALFGAGSGTIVYLLFTKFRSPVFLGSSFAFIPSMFVAFAGAISMEMGFLGLVIGAAFAALVYVIIAIIVKFAGVKWELPDASGSHRTNGRDHWSFSGRECGLRCAGRQLQR